MKRIRTLISILLAIVLLLIPSAVLADDPPDLEVDIGIISGGDVDVDLGIQAGGDVSIDVGTNSNVNVNGDGLATQDDLTAANQGTVQYEEFVCGGSRTAIKEIYKLLEELYGRQYLISSGLAKEIMLAEEQQVRLNWVDVNHNRQNSTLASLETYDTYLNEKMDVLTDVANHQVTALNRRVAQQEQAQLAMWQDYNLKLMIASFIAIALAITLVVILARRRRA